MAQKSAPSGYRSVAVLIASLVSVFCFVSPSFAQSEPEVLEWPIKPVIKQECSVLQGPEWGECAMRPDCTLYSVQNAKSVEPFYNGYGCRSSKGQCEQGFKQAVTPKQELAGRTPEAICMAKRNCQYVPEGRCWCPPGTLRSCICSGGTPPNCIKR